MIEIPLISQDIRPDEVTIRALKTFEYLEKSVDQIFDRIDARITKNMTRIDNINARLEKANEKIDKLKKSKKAIRMYSSARYPIESLPKIEPTFDRNFTLGEINFNYKLDLPLYENTENTEPKQFGDKLAFFHLKRSRKPIPHKPNVVFNTSSVNSLITFVNNENLYLKDLTKAREKEVLVEQVVDEANDFSKFSTMMRNKQQDNLHYFPTFHQAPEFEFPLDLPDLDGIAGDISFSVPDSELIATPTLWSMNIVNELPNFNELLEAETKKSKENTVENENVPLPPSVPQNIPILPLNIPPPPPIPKNLTIPPPPPPAIPIEIKNVATPTSVDDSRSSLMKAIRDAGGKAKLKSMPAAAADEPDFSKKKQPQQKEPAKDLMSDLHEKLMLRRKGIAGSKEAKKEKSSIMSKVSSLIPPPPKKTESDSDSSSNMNDDEEDWN